MAAVAPNTIEILGRRLDLQPKVNPNYARPAVEHVNAYLKETNGAFRFLQLIQRITSLVAISLKEAGNSMAHAVDQFAGKLSTGCSVLIFSRLLDVSLKSKRAVTNWSGNFTGPLAKREMLERVHDIVDANASWGYASFIVTSHPICKKVADIHTLAADVTDLAMAAQDFQAAQVHLNALGKKDGTNDQLHDQITHTMRSTCFKVVKSVIAMFTGVLALMSIGLGLHMSGLLALVGTICAMGSHFWQEVKNPYEKIEFYKVQSPVALA